MNYFDQDLALLEDKLAADHLTPRELALLFKTFAELCKRADKAEGFSINQFSLLGHVLTPKQVNYVALYCAELSLQGVDMEDILCSKHDKFCLQEFFPECPGLDDEFLYAIQRGLFHRIKELECEYERTISEKKKDALYNSREMLSKAFAKESFKGQKLKLAANKPEDNEHYIDGFEMAEMKTLHNQ